LFNSAEDFIHGSRFFDYFCNYKITGLFIQKSINNQLQLPFKHIFNSNRFPAPKADNSAFS